MERGAWFMGFPGNGTGLSDQPATSPAQFKHLDDINRLRKTIQAVAPPLGDNGC